MPLVEHLFELRNRLGKAVLAIAVGMVLIGVVFYQPVFDFLREPYCRTPAAGKECALYVRDIFGQFQVRLKVSAIGGVVCTAPIWLYQLGAFITPALHRRERRYALAFLGSSLILFAAGVVCAYLTMDKGLQFLLTVGGDGLVSLPDLQSYLGFATLTLLAFGFSFLFPVVLMFLNVVGILPAWRMRKMWRGMIVGIAFFTAVITPSTDPFTFIVLGVPLYLMYEVCIVIARLRERGARKRAAVEALEEIPDDQPSDVDTTLSQI